MSSYEKPEIRSLRADQVVELMGPVSCGSGQIDPLPTGGGSPSKMVGPGPMSLNRSR